MRTIPCRLKNGSRCRNGVTNQVITKRKKTLPKMLKQPRKEGRQVNPGTATVFGRSHKASSVKNESKHNFLHVGGADPPHRSVSQIEQKIKEDTQNNMNWMLTLGELLWNTETLCWQRRRRHRQKLRDTIVGALKALKDWTGNKSPAQAGADTWMDHGSTSLATCEPRRSHSPDNANMGQSGQSPSSRKAVIR